MSEKFVEELRKAYRLHSDSEKGKGYWQDQGRAEALRVALCGENSFRFYKASHSNVFMDSLYNAAIADGLQVLFLPDGLEFTW